MGKASLLVPREGDPLLGTVMCHRACIFTAWQRRAAGALGNAGASLRSRQGVRPVVIPLSDPPEPTPMPGRGPVTNTSFLKDEVLLGLSVSCPGSAGPSGLRPPWGGRASKRAEAGRD